jgi:hypothetical protein
LEREGYRSWLDVKMGQRGEAAMQEGVSNSKCLLAVFTDDGGAGCAYFERPLCLQELRWALEHKVFVQPVFAAHDKGRITEMLSKLPADLYAVLKATDAIHLDRSDNDYWAVGLGKILKAFKRECLQRGLSSSQPGSPPFQQRKVTQP